MIIKIEGQNKMKSYWKLFLSIGISIFLLYLGIHYWPSAASFLSAVFSAAMPIWVGCGIAYVVNILMAFYERHYFPQTQKSWVSCSRRPVCMIGAILTLIAVIVLIFALVIPQISSCIALLVTEIPASIEKLLQFLTSENLLPEDILKELSSVNWQERLGQIATTLVAGVGSLLDFVISAASSVVSVVTTTVLAIIFAIYLLAGKERLGRQSRHFLQHYLPEKWYQKLIYVLSVLNESFHKFIVGQFTEAIILGSLCTIGMLLLRLPYATMLGALIGFTALIPVVGAFIGGALGAFLILMESPIQALIFVIFLVILQQLEGNLIYPRVVGTSIGLPSIWVLAVVTVGGSVFGILGILLGIPVAAAIYRMIYHNMHPSDIPAPNQKHKEDSDA